MTNGIIINGVEYEASTLPDGVSGCEFCDMWEYCKGDAVPCELWSGNVNFKFYKS